MVSILRVLLLVLQYFTKFIHEFFNYGGKEGLILKVFFVFLVILSPSNSGIST